jgi:hypothetical protein
MNFGWLIAFGFLVLFMGGCASKVPQTSLATPEKTFETWRQAASRLDMEALLSTYSSSSRPMIEDELARSTEDALRSMQKETKKTRFEIERVLFENNIAYLRVRRRVGRADEVEVLTMIKEGEDWKIQP